jgi:sec-independent protein translocase protein TatB
MVDSVRWGEVLVIVLAGLFILGPDRLPGAAAWLGQTVRQVKGYASGAQDRISPSWDPSSTSSGNPSPNCAPCGARNPRRFVVP